MDFTTGEPYVGRTAVAEHTESAMPVPDYESLMLPLLRALADGAEYPVRDLRERLAAAAARSKERRQPLESRAPRTRLPPLETNIRSRKVSP